MVGAIKFDVIIVFLAAKRVSVDAEYKAIPPSTKALPPTKLKMFLSQMYVSLELFKKIYITI